MKHPLAGIVALVLATVVTTSCGDSMSNSTGPSGSDAGTQDGTTSCGASAEPCCNGATCTAGLTCSSGTCSGSSPASDGTVDSAGDVVVGDVAEAPTIGLEAGDAPMNDVEAVADSEASREAGTGTDGGCGPDADLMDDPNNCGACGVHCCSVSVCIAGVCTGDCSAGWDLCGLGSGPDGCRNNYICTSLSSDPCNCGGCGLACDAGTSCIGGSCMAVEGGAGCR